VHGFDDVTNGGDAAFDLTFKTNQWRRLHGRAGACSAPRAIVCPAFRAMVDLLPGSGHTIRT
jgi:hypothetical protein